METRSAPPVSVWIDWLCGGGVHMHRGDMHFPVFLRQPFSITMLSGERYRHL